MNEKKKKTIFSGFTKDINGINEIHLKGNQLDLIGKYVLRGQVLILPVIGIGDANITIRKSFFHRD